MSHKADESFFKTKRHWSKRKDRILGSYLTVYLPKIATQKASILIVDGFAGPGKFDDGQPGSPHIICKVAQNAIEGGLRESVHVLCIEPSDSLFERLENNLEGFGFATPEHGQFSDSVNRISHLAKTHSVFLYIDPFTVEGLVWDEMHAVFQHLRQSRSSVEVLINFNAASFARRGLSAMKLAIPDIDPRIEDAQAVDADFDEPAKLQKLNAVLGTDKWQSLLQENVPFFEKVKNLQILVCHQLKSVFQEVCSHTVLAEPHHTVPKYYLVFASRYPGAVRLFNDEVVKSRRTLADRAKPASLMLFETRSVELVPDLDQILPLVRKHAEIRASRGDVIIDVIRDAFGDFASKEIRGRIQEMLESGELVSSTGKKRINDDVEIWLATGRQ